MTRPNPPPVRDRNVARCSKPKLLFLVEGANDIEFLRRISRILHSHQHTLPDLCRLEASGEILFLPFGGGDLKLWTTRLAPLNMPELHLYDGESDSESSLRQVVQAAVNRRSRCRAFVTRKRSLENYLHPGAVYSASGLNVTFGDHDSVAEIVAQGLHKRHHAGDWKDLPYRLQKRRRDRAKRWLNTKAVDCMTVELLAKQDPDGEIAMWLNAVSQLTR